MNNGLIKKTINKVKNKYNNYLLECKLEKEFKDKNNTYTIYKKNSIVSYIVYGYINKNNIFIYGNHLDKINSIIVCDNNMFYINDVKITDTTIKYDNKEYVRECTVLIVDNNIEEVDVIKVNKKYYKHK